MRGHTAGTRPSFTALYGGDLTWVTRDAACSVTDPEAFFRPSPDRHEALRRACQECPLQAPCLEYALAHHVDGYWAATSNEDRENLRLGIPTQRRAPEKDNCGTTAGYRLHLRRRDVPCTPCMAAAAAYRTTLNRKKRDV
jgi:WhiB family redox-sensing transcriptional regulator